MGRYRPPAPPKSPYITKAGYQILSSELDQLWDKRKEVTAAVTAAAAEGDRSENAEYIYRKKQLREIDWRIRYLQKRLPELKVVETTPANQQQIFFGAKVELEKEDGALIQYRIVGSDEFDPSKSWISIDSPMAKALLKKELDDEVIVQTPGGKQVYFVAGVSYKM